QGVFLPGIAKRFAEAADLGANEAREQILLGTARAYLALQGTSELLKAAQDAERVSIKREDDAKAQIAAGTAVELNLLRAQTETASARVNIAAIEGQRQQLYPLLEGLVGEAVDVVPVGTGSELPTAMRSDKDEPWESSFAVRSAIEQVHGTEKSVDYDTWQWLPSIVGIAKGNYNSNEGFTGHNFTYDLIVAAQIPLYDRGARYAQRKEDLAKLQQALANLAASRARARSNWLGARANVGAAEAQLKQAQAQEALATRAQSQVDASAKAGLATSLDLVDADNRRFLASSNVVQARTSLEVRRAELLTIEGKLFEQLAATKQ
ncbi:MAG: TolC family protein, partial [Deltaproteobacteria bacterium]|nr:TolC family protein [Deltaproteobacteria bacterium]